MNNVLAIARKELRSYFASPIAYIVIGLFAVIFGIFFGVILLNFNQASQQGGGQAVNVNEQLIRPVFLNSVVVFLFMLPIVTMRSYAEEKRSGTIELLLTAPLTDLQIILGKFTGAMGLYASMLLVTALSMGSLFFFGTPEVKPLLNTYLGLLLMGGCFVSVGLLISSFTSNQIVAGAVTFGVFLILWVINWPAPFAPWPWLQTFLNYASIVDHFDDFSRGVLDTKHVVYYISFIAVGLFLTARSVDTERWRG
ncbi:MAG TPA: ABC transporter permease [Vicinamibacterales bacterium]|nr:ABC transporter permease [Vicinamibacterales bacterium]